MKQVIWDLFSGSRSVEKSVDLEKITYFGFDINVKGNENLYLDLTSKNVVMYLELMIEYKIIEKPNFIWASPICNYFSRAVWGEGGNFYFEEKDGKILPRKNWDIKCHQYMEKFKYEVGNIRALSALKMIENTILIINKFCDNFVIENPAHNLARTIYINEHKLIANETHYCAWDEELSKKPTNIYSNKKLNLRKCPHNNKHSFNIQNSPKQTGYDKRASVPPELIKEILKQMLGDK